VEEVEVLAFLPPIESDLPRILPDPKPGLSEKPHPLCSFFLATTPKDTDQGGFNVRELKRGESGSLHPSVEVVGGE